jgi:hypothetical protein
LAASQQGWLWSRLPLTAANFVIEVEFKVRYIYSFYRDTPLFIVLQIAGSTGHLHGDGLALWITSERAQPGPVFGSKGKQHTLSSPETEAYEYNYQIISLESESSLIRAHFCTPKYSEPELIMV